MSFTTRSRQIRKSRQFSKRPRLEWLERRDLLASYTTPEDTTLVVSDPALVGFALVTAPEHGVVQPTNAGGFAYIPAANYFGPDRFTYTLLTPTTSASEAGDEEGDVEEVTITVTPVNDPPVAVPDEYSTFRNKRLSVAAPGVLKNDKDVDNNSLRAELVSEAAHGVVSLAADGSFTYTPNENYAGPDFFTYRASDSVAAENSNSLVAGSIAKVFINVRGLPDARDDQYSVAQGGLLNVPPRGVLQNDQGIGERGLIASLEPGEENAPKHGTVVLNADGSFTYKPAEGYFGPDSFVYRATDKLPVPEPGSTLPQPGPAAFDLARVHIYVRPSPQVRANPDVFETLNDRPLLVPAPGVLKNDFVFYPQPPTPDPATNSATTNLQTGAGTTTTPPNILPPNPPLFAKLLTRPDKGELVFRENGSFEYRPAANFTGTVTFTYQARLAVTTSGALANSEPDNRPLDVATVTIHVRAPVPPPGPIAHNDFFLAVANTPLAIEAPGVLANDSPRGPVVPAGSKDTAPIVQPLVAELVERPAHGTLVLRPNGSFEYVPDANFVGTDSFRYRAAFSTVTDPASASAADFAPAPGSVATVTIRVVPAIARNDEYRTLQNLPLEIAAPGVLSNDVGGSDEHPLSAVLVSKPQHGTLELDASGAFVYRPKPNFAGTDVFVYRAESDLAANPSLAASFAPDGTPANVQPGNLGIVRIHVRAVRPSVQAYPDKYATPQNVPLVVAEPGVLANDYALVNHRVEASVAEQPAHGTVALNADGSFTYTPAENFTGEDRFVYKATDLDAAASNTAAGPNFSLATVVIRVYGDSAPPRFIGGGNLRATDEGGQQQISDWATLLALAGDGQPSFTVTTDRPELFAVPPTIDAAGQLNYAPAPNVKGTAQVAVALDGDTQAATTFTIEIDKPHPLFNAANAYDVTGDDSVRAGDALAIINHINAFGITSAVAEGESPAGLYLDVSKDNVVSALDALLVINYINAGLDSGFDSGGAEGEAAAAAVDLSLLALMSDDTADPRKKR